MPNLLFITTTNLSTNPRLLKELKLASENGSDCTFIGFELGNWSDKTEYEHLKSAEIVKTHYLSSTKSPLLQWLLSTIVWKLSNILNKLFTKSTRINAYAHNKRTWQICKQLKRLRNNYDIIVAHNLGALYPAYYFSKKRNIPFAFDIEDYHPGEKCSLAEKHRREFLMQKLLPKAYYVSYASPLIGKYSLDLISKAELDTSQLDAFKYMATSTKCISRTVCDIDLSDENETENTIKLPDNFLINNSFSQNEFQLVENGNEKIQFVWFSQNIAQGRGLELIIPALSRFKDRVHLTLIGNLYGDFEESFLKDYLDFIDFQAPLPQKDLNLYLCRFDVGLAIELSSTDFNRDICLTNKTFAYTQAGLFVLATDTSAQQLFIKEHNERCNSLAETEDSQSLNRDEMRGVGLLTPQTTEEMAKAIEKILNNIDEVRANKKSRFEYAKRLAWEHEGPKLLTAWNKLF